MVKMSNVMREIKIEKLTLNFGAGKDMSRLEKGMKLIKHITNKDAVKTVTSKRIPGWGIRPGLPIGCKITIRKGFKELIKKLLGAKNNVLSIKQFDVNGNVAFGIHEYIDIPGVEYNPEIGMLGLQVCITLTRPGFRIKCRRLRKAKIPKKHRISREEAIEFMKKEFNIEIES